MTLFSGPQPSASSFAPTFSGHETFIMRSTWLKKAYDELQKNPHLFADDLAFVRLGVGKNMAQSIRYWGRVCSVFEQDPQGGGYRATPIGEGLLADNGWDPFLVSPASWWLLHWHIAARREAAFTWYYTFNRLRGGEFTVSRLVEQLQSLALEQNWREPSAETLERDIDCMIRCYLRPTIKANAPVAEDALLCPLNELGLMQFLPSSRIYRLVTGPQPTLPTALVAWAILQVLNPAGQQVDAFQRRTLVFNDLAYAAGMPGKVFRLDEDSLLHHLLLLEYVTAGSAMYTDSAGIRQVQWKGDLGPDMALFLLDQAMRSEVHHG